MTDRAVLEQALQILDGRRMQKERELMPTFFVCLFSENYTLSASPNKVGGLSNLFGSGFGNSPISARRDRSRSPSSER